MNALFPKYLQYGQVIGQPSIDDEVEADLDQRKTGETWAIPIFKPTFEAEDTGLCFDAPDMMAFGAHPGTTIWRTTYHLPASYPSPDITTTSNITRMGR